MTAMETNTGIWAPPAIGSARGVSALENGEAALRVMQTHGMLALEAFTSETREFEVSLPDGSTHRVPFPELAGWIGGYRAAWHHASPGAPRVSAVQKVAAEPRGAAPSARAQRADEDSMTIAQAAEMLGVTRRMLEDRIRQGLAPDPDRRGPGRRASTLPRATWTAYGISVGWLNQYGNRYPRLVSAAAADGVLTTPVDGG